MTSSVYGNKRFLWPLQTTLLQRCRYRVSEVPARQEKNCVIVQLSSVIFWAFGPFGVSEFSVEAFLLRSTKNVFAFSLTALCCLLKPMMASFFCAVTCLDLTLRFPLNGSKLMLCAQNQVQTSNRCILSRNNEGMDQNMSLNCWSGNCPITLFMFKLKVDVSVRTSLLFSPSSPYLWEFKTNYWATVEILIYLTESDVHFSLCVFYFPLRWS